LQKWLQNLSHNEIICDNIGNHFRILILIAVFCNVEAVAVLVATAVVAPVPSQEHIRSPSPSLNPNPPSVVVHAQNPSKYFCFINLFTLFITMYIYFTYFIFFSCAVSHSQYTLSFPFIILALFLGWLRALSSHA